LGRKEKHMHRIVLVELDPSLSKEEENETLQAIRAIPGVVRVSDVVDNVPDVIDDEKEVKILTPDMVIPTQPVYTPPAYLTRQHAIYEWYEHETGIIRYIGITSKSIEARTKDHLREAFKERHFYDWLRMCFDNSALPGVREVDTAPNKTEAHLKEQQHIQDAIRFGHPLFNKEAGTNASLMYNKMLISRMP
jgi:hypothetical protein